MIFPFNSHARFLYNVHYFIITLQFYTICISAPAEVNNNESLESTESVLFISSYAFAGQGILSEYLTLQRPGGGRPRQVGWFYDSKSQVTLFKYFQNTRWSLACKVQSLSLVYQHKLMLKVIIICLSDAFNDLHMLITFSCRKKLLFYVGVNSYNKQNLKEQFQK